MTKKTLHHHLALGIALVLTTTAAALAQSPAGSIRGTVFDPSGALIPQARVTIANASGFSRTIKSNATGAFELPHLAPGSYSISINASGFTPALDGGIQVVGDKVTHENIVLGISVNQEIEVLADDDAAAQDDASASGR